MVRVHPAWVRRETTIALMLMIPLLKRVSLMLLWRVIIALVMVIASTATILLVQRLLLVPIVTCGAIAVTVRGRTSLLSLHRMRRRLLIVVEFNPVVLLLPIVIIPSLMVLVIIESVIFPTRSLIQRHLIVLLLLIPT